MKKNLDLLLKPLLKTVTKLELSPIKTGMAFPPTYTHFGGEPYAEEGEFWPICSGCEKQLSFICQVNTIQGLHEKPMGIDLFTFFYCWDCAPWGGEDEQGTWAVRAFRQPSPEKARPIYFKGKDLSPTIPCKVDLEKAQVLPVWAGLEIWSPRVQEACVEADEENPWDSYESALRPLIGEPEIFSMIGGYPQWIQDDDTPDCQDCESRMELLAQIDSEDKARIMWGDLGCLYIFYCPQHPSRIQIIMQCC